MQTRNPFLDDLAKMANGAMGALSGVKDEMEARFRDKIAKILDGMDIPRRDEFDAVKAMAANAREENEELKKQIAELQAKLAGAPPPTPPSVVLREAIASDVTFAVCRNGN